MLLMSLPGCKGERSAQCRILVQGTDLHFCELQLHRGSLCFQDIHWTRSPFFMTGHNPIAMLFNMYVNQPGLSLGIKHRNTTEKKKKVFKYFENYLCLLLLVQKSLYEKKKRFFWQLNIILLLCVIKWSLLKVMCLRNLRRCRFPYQSDHFIE